MIRTQISVDAELYDRARALAKRQSISFAELCRRSLQAAVSREPNDKPWMAHAGTIDDGHPDDSSTVDEVVYGRDAP